MQNKNTIVFFILSFLILIGWLQVQKLIWPPPTKALPPPPEARLLAQVAGLAMTPDIPGLAQATALAADLAVAQHDWTADKRQQVAEVDHPPEPKPEPAKPQPAVKAPAAVHKEPVLGDDNANLKV